MEENRYQVVFAIDRDDLQPSMEEHLHKVILRVMSALGQSPSTSGDSTPILEFGFRFYRTRFWKSQLKRYSFKDFGWRSYSEFLSELKAGSRPDSRPPGPPTGLSKAAILQILLKEIGHDFPWRKKDAEEVEKRAPAPNKRGNAKTHQKQQSASELALPKNHLFFVGQAPADKEELNQFLGTIADIRSDDKKDKDDKNDKKELEKRRSVKSGNEKERFIGVEKNSSIATNDSLFEAVFPPLVANLYVHQLSCAVSWIDLKTHSSSSSPSSSSPSSSSPSSRSCDSANNFSDSSPSQVCPQFSWIFRRLNGGCVIGFERLDSHSASFLHDIFRHKFRWRKWETELAVGQEKPIPILLHDVSGSPSSSSSLETALYPKLVAKAALPLTSLDVDYLNFSHSFLCTSESSSFAKLLSSHFNKSTVLLVESNSNLYLLFALNTNSALGIKLTSKAGIGSLSHRIDPSLLRRQLRGSSIDAGVKTLCARLRDRLNDASKPRTFLPLTPAQLAAKKRKFRNGGVEEPGKSCGTGGASSRMSTMRSFQRRSSSGLERSLIMIEEGRRRSKEGEDLAAAAASSGKRRNSMNPTSHGSPSSLSQHQQNSPSQDAQLKKEELMRRRERFYGSHVADNLDVIGVQEEKELLELLSETYLRVLEEEADAMDGNATSSATASDLDKFDSQSSNKVLHAVQAIINSCSRFFKLKENETRETATANDSETRMTKCIRDHFVKSKSALKKEYMGKFDEASLRRKMKEYETQAILRLELESWSPTFKEKDDDDDQNQNDEDEDDDVSGEVVSFLQIRDLNYIKAFLKEFLMTNFLHLEAAFLVGIFEELLQPIPELLSSLMEGRSKSTRNGGGAEDEDSDDELTKRLRQWNEGGASNSSASYEANPSISALLSLQGNSLNGSYVSNASNLSQGSTKTFKRHSSLQQTGNSQRQIVVPTHKRTEKAGSKRKPARVKKNEVAGGGGRNEIVSTLNSNNADHANGVALKGLSQSCVIGRSKSSVQPDSETKRVRRNLFDDDDDDENVDNFLTSPQRLANSRKLGFSPGTTGSGRKGKRLLRTPGERNIIPGESPSSASARRCIGEDLPPQTPPKRESEKVLKDKTVTETPNHKQMPMQERLVMLRQRMIEKVGATQDEASSVLKELVIEESPVKSTMATVSSRRRILEEMTTTKTITTKDDKLTKLKAKSRSSISFAESASTSSSLVENESPATRASSLVRRRSFYTHNSDHKSRNFDKYLQSRDLADRIGGRKRLHFNDQPLATSSVADEVDGEFEKSEDLVDEASGGEGGRGVGRQCSSRKSSSFARNLFASDSPPVASKNLNASKNLQSASPVSVAAKSLFREASECQSIFLESKYLREASVRQSSFSASRSFKDASNSQTSLDDDVFCNSNNSSGESQIIGGKSLTFGSLDMQRLSQSSGDDDGVDDDESCRRDGIDVGRASIRSAKESLDSCVKTPERKAEGGFDKWPRIKPRFGIQSLFPNRSFSGGGGGGGGAACGGGSLMLDNRVSPIRDSVVTSKKRELSPPGSPDLFKTPSKKRKVESRDPLLSPPGRGGGAAAASSLLWGTDQSPSKTTPKKTLISPLKSMNSPLSGNFFSPSKRLLGFGSPHRPSPRGNHGSHGLSPHPSGMNSLSRTPTKSPSIASILHLVTSPMKGERKKTND